MALFGFYHLFFKKYNINQLFLFLKRQINLIDESCDTVYINQFVTLLVFFCMSRLLSHITILNLCILLYFSTPLI